MQSATAIWNKLVRGRQPSSINEFKRHSDLFLEKEGTGSTMKKGREVGFTDVWEGKSCLKGGHLKRESSMYVFRGISCFYGCPMHEQSPSPRKKDGFPLWSRFYFRDSPELGWEDEFFRPPQCQLPTAILHIHRETACQAWRDLPITKVSLSSIVRTLLSLGRIAKRKKQVSKHSTTLFANRMYFFSTIMIQAM